jgi:hypothetical protein
MVSALEEFLFDLFGSSAVLLVGVLCRVLGNVECYHRDPAILGDIPVLVLLSFGVIFVVNVCT